jgi:outer membrane protein OmpA-like peptidoglycan-associated protein
VGAGSGFAFGNSGYGRELYRVFLGLRWERLVSSAGPAPEGDRDGDGVPDAQDRCPDRPGPAELEGCPDRDGDGVPDIDDKCPDVPGPAQNDGCPPPAGEPLVEIETDRLSLKDAITFDTGRDTLRPESGHILDEVARILAQHPELTRIRVEGHTDNVGGKAYNQDLSQRRARAVVRALGQRGIAAGRLEAQGYGFDRPVASNATAAGRAKNRRVEFTIVGERGGTAR